MAITIQVRIINMNYQSFFSAIDFSNPLLYFEMFHIFLNPFLWNAIGQIEYKTRKISKLFGGNAKLAVYMVFIVIFSLGLSRNYLYKVIVDNSTQLDWNETLCNVIGYLFWGIGMTLVVSSSWRLGIIGTYDGDYVNFFYLIHVQFGLLFDEKITGFPYNLTDSPMYDGSTLNFLGHAFTHRSPVGFFLTLWVYIIYRIGCHFEDYYTNKIYSEAGRIKAQEKPKRQAKKKEF